MDFNFNLKKFFSEPNVNERLVNYNMQWQGKVFLGQFFTLSDICENYLDYAVNLLEKRDLSYVKNLDQRARFIYHSINGDKIYKSYVGEIGFCNNKFFIIIEGFFEDGEGYVDYNNFIKGENFFYSFDVEEYSKKIVKFLDDKSNREESYFDKMEAALC